MSTLHHSAPIFIPFWRGSKVSKTTSDYERLRRATDRIFRSLNSQESISEPYIAASMNSEPSAQKGLNDIKLKMASNEIPY